jgi:hypothetical protein
MIYSSYYIFSRGVVKRLTFLNTNSGNPLANVQICLQNQQSKGFAGSSGVVSLKEIRKERSLARKREIRWNCYIPHAR